MPRDRLAAAAAPVAVMPRPVPVRNGDRSAAKFSVRRIVTVPAVLLWLVGGPRSATAQDDEATVGVRYRVDASVSIGPDSPLIRRARQTGFADAESVVNLQIRISSNSREIQYFGVISKDLPLRQPPAHPIWHKVWEEAVCHQRRGQPKLTVVRVSGRWPAPSGGAAGAPPALPQPTHEASGTAPPNQTAASWPSPHGDLIPREPPPPANTRTAEDFTSVVRHIGMPLRPDELVPGIKLPEGIDDVGPYYALRAQTKDTRLNADLRLYAFACRVDAARLAPQPEQSLR
ncbi:hypothetical protein [Rhodopseudomonas telluris]|uniref:Uncharacterized protein n=1 Tax=Rhodopseudomonas telluris TaxID=644215 RepID=A0ABV6EVY6_9BRAD